MTAECRRAPGAFLSDPHGCTFFFTQVCATYNEYDVTVFLRMSLWRLNELE